MQHERRRRIDRVTSEDYLEGLAAADLATVRGMRDDCREEETRLSYARRVVQGQVDIVRAQQAQRDGSDGGDLVGALTRILADDPAPRARDARTSPVYSPTDSGYGQRSHDTLIDDPALGRVPDLDDDELSALLERLQEKEQHISSLRRAVLDHLDALQAELIRRYSDGSVDIDEVVASAVPPPADDT